MDKQQLPEIKTDTPLHLLNGFADTKVSKLDGKSDSGDKSSSGRYGLTTIPLTVLFGCFLMLLGCILLIVINARVIISPVNTGDTVYLCDVANSFWGLRLDLWDFPRVVDDVHNASVFVVPTSNVKNHSTQETFKGDAVYFENASRNAGNLLSMYQMLSLTYNVTAKSENATTVDGQLIIFRTKDDYQGYVQYGFKYIVKASLFVQNFTIGTNNESKSTIIKFNSQAEINQYSFVTCSIPANVTFSYNATVMRAYYDYKDFGERRCVIKDTLPSPDSPCSCSIEVPPYDAITLFALADPNKNKYTSSTTHIKVIFNRMLPPPSVLVFISAFIVLLPSCAIMMYFYVFKK